MKKSVKTGRGPRLAEEVNMSEAFINASLLSLSGGLQDVYTYLMRGHVFANAQTGNIVLLSVNLVEKNYQLTLGYFIPLISFALGVALSKWVQYRHQGSQNFHWRQRVLVIEIALLFAVGFLPLNLNVLANALVSFSCAMQVQTFRKVKGSNYASTMCIGNLRSGMESLCLYFMTKNKKRFKVAFRYFSIIFFFACGAGLGSFLLPIFKLKTIWASCLLLLLSFSLLFFEKREPMKNHLA